MTKPAGQPAEQDANLPTNLSADSIFPSTIYPFLIADSKAAGITVSVVLLQIGFRHLRQDRLVVFV